MTIGSWVVMLLPSSPQRRLGSQGVKGSAVFTRRGPGLRWGDGFAPGPHKAAGRDVQTVERGLGRGMMHRLALPVAAAAFAASVALAQGPQASAPAPKQDYAWPERIANAKVLPADIG